LSGYSLRRRLGAARRRRRGNGGIPHPLVAARLVPLPATRGEGWSEEIATHTGRA